MSSRFFFFSLSGSLSFLLKHPSKKQQQQQNRSSNNNRNIVVFNENGYIQTKYILVFFFNKKLKEQMVTRVYTSL